VIQGNQEEKRQKVKSQDWIISLLTTVTVYDAIAMWA
jgi:hypothetical protein